MIPLRLLFYNQVAGGKLLIAPNMQGQGHKSKSNELGEVLKKCEKREAKLIGYDDKPFLTSKFGDLELPQVNSECNSDSNETGTRP